MGSSIDLRAERRALICLMLAFGLQLVTNLVYQLVDFRDVSEAVLALLQRSGDVVDVLFLGAFASALYARQSGLARAALAAAMLVVCASPLLDLVFDRGQVDAQATRTVGLVLWSVWVVALGLALFDVALASRRVGALVGAGVVVALLVVQTLLRQTQDTDPTLRLVMRFVYNGLALVPLIWRLVTMPRGETARAQPSAWRRPADGVRLVRIAVVGQLVTSMLLIVLALLAMEDGKALVFVFVLGALASLVFAGLNVVGLGRARRMPRESDAGGPLTAAWSLAVVAFAMTIGAMLVFLYFVLVHEAAASEYAEVMQKVQGPTTVLGVGVTGALYNGARRVGRALGDSAVQGQALATLVIGMVFGVVGVIMQQQDVVKELLGDRAGVVVAVFTLISAIVLIVLVLSTLAALERALRRELEAAEAPSFGASA